MRRGLISVFIAFVLLSASALPVFAAKSLVRIDGLTRAQIREMAQKGYDIARSGDGFIEAVVDDSQAKELKRSSAKYSSLIPDLDRYVANVLAGQRAGAKYYTYQTMTDALKDYASKYPKICRMESVGKSCENRDIWALKISDNPEVDEKEPAVLIMGAHHSREWISFEVPMATIKTLIEGYGKDDKLTQLVNEREIWFVPMVNPDGVVYSQEKEVYWRKNRRKNADGSFGVDPNRNYGYQWGNAGASNDPDSDLYHGPGPFSEPETQTIRDLAKREKFSADITFHSYSELILYPWSYTDSTSCEHHDLFAKFAGEMAAFNKYTPEVSADLYPSSGDTDDFMYGEMKSLSFTFELARTFIPAASEISKICAANVPAVLHLIDKSGTYGLVTPAGLDTISNLDTSTAVSAITDLSPFSSDMQAANALQKLQTEIARRIVEEGNRGETSTLDLVKQSGESSAVFPAILKTVRELQIFANLHQPTEN